MSEHARDMDWSPPGGEPPRGRSKPEWKVDDDGHEIAIYEVPVLSSPKATLRKIATCDRRSDADFIVSLYDQHKKGLL